MRITTSETRRSPKVKVVLSDKYVPVLKNRGMNYAAALHPPFSFVPTSFTSTIEGLKPKVFSQARQLEMFEDFLANPFKPATYCIVSAPNDGQAKLFAAFLMQHVIKNHNGKGLPVWHDLTQGFDSPLIKERSNASLLVLNNVGATSTPAKLEKLRDILTYYADIPRIVVATGADPFMFFTQYLYLTLHSCAYMTGPLVKRLEL